MKAVYRNLQVLLAYPSLVPFVLRHPSFAIARFRSSPHPRSTAISSYLSRLMVLKAVRQFEKLCSSWDFINLERAKSVAEQELERSWFRWPHWQSCLYVLCRVMRPETVVETGVSAGSSSHHILQALSDNERGILYSIDLPDASYVLDNSKLHRDPLPSYTEPGFVVPDELRRRWRLIIGSSSERLPKLMRQLGDIDIFVHDSEHTYDNMMFEFATVWPHIRYGGLLISDDVTCNDAFVQFCMSHGANYAIITRLGLAIKK